MQDHTTGVTNFGTRIRGDKIVTKIIIENSFSRNCKISVFIKLNDQTYQISQTIVENAYWKKSYSA